MRTVNATAPEPPRLDRVARSKYDVKTVRELMAGRWYGYATDVLRIPDDYLTTRHRDCPKCNPGSINSDRFRVFNDFEQTGGAICSQCGTGKSGCGMADGISLTQWYLGCDFVTAINEIGDYANAPQRKITDKSGTKKRARKKLPCVSVVTASSATRPVSPRFTRFRKSPVKVPNTSSRP